MMTPSNENIFRVTSPLCEDFTGHWWISLTKDSEAELWCFRWSAPEQTNGTPVTWDSIALVMTSLLWDGRAQQNTTKRQPCAYILGYIIFTQREVLLCHNNCIKHTKIVYPCAKRLQTLSEPVHLRQIGILGRIISMIRLCSRQTVDIIGWQLKLAGRNPRRLRKPRTTFLKIKLPRSENKYINNQVETRSELLA